MTRNEVPKPVGRIQCCAYRWLDRKKDEPSDAEKNAYLEGLFDAGISNDDQYYVEKLLYGKVVSR